MKPFIFKLEAALNLKIKQEDKQKEELERLNKVYQDNLKILRVLEEKLFSMQENLRQYQAEIMDVIKVQCYHEYLPVMKEKIDSQKHKVELMLQEVEKARNVLTEIMRERKILEKLKSRHFEDYMKELRREEQKLIDEMAIIRFVNSESIQRGNL